MLKRNSYFNVNKSLSSTRWTTLYVHCSVLNTIKNLPFCTSNDNGCIIYSIHPGMYDGGEHTPKLLHCSHTVCLECLDRIVATFARDTGQFR